VPEIILVRHGSTAWSDRFTGHCDVELSADGRAEARKLAATLAASRPRAVISSDLRRAAATAAEVSAVYAVDPRLCEEDLGGWSGLTHEAVRERFPDEYARWRAGHVWAATANREGLTAVADRAVPAIREAVAGGTPLVVVTHANTVYAIVRRLLGVVGPWADLPPAGFLTLG
jgi:glucosyl-3-phosphoglycerate phosphatase